MAQCRENRSEGPVGTTRLNSLLRKHQVGAYLVKPMTTAITVQGQKEAKGHQRGRRPAWGQAVAEGML